MPRMEVDANIFLCPVTLDIFKLPVILEGSGWRVEEAMAAHCSRI